jgi:hypothetical protein
VSCKLCGKPLAYPGAVFCGAACSTRWEAGERPKTDECNHGGTCITAAVCEARRAMEKREKR